MLNSSIRMSSIGSKNDQLTRVDLEQQIDDLLDERHFDALLDHSYTKQNSSTSDSIDISALTYFIGYIARQIKKFSTAKHCENCYLSLINDVDINEQNLDPEDNLIKSRSKGFLLIPSNSLKEIIFKLEVIITKIIDDKCIKQHILKNVTFLKHNKYKL